MIKWYQQTSILDTSDYIVIINVMMNIARIRFEAFDQFSHN